MPAKIGRALRTGFVAYDNGKMTTTTTIRKSYGNRKLYTFPEDYPIRTPRLKSGSVNNLVKKSDDVNKLIKYIDDNIVGKNNAFLGPFGRRKGNFVFGKNCVSLTNKKILTIWWVKVQCCVFLIKIFLLIF